ncbi:MAG: NrfD/PsrC family molybdoenzyme membrane anchor subunit [Syntrophorhabdales bacterium]|jgi:hypothetical protein
MSLPSDRDLYPGTPVSWLVISTLLALAGIAAFLIGISGNNAARAWQIYVVNYVFWAGLAYGAVLFSAVLNLAKATWGRPLKRLAESFGAYLPVSFLLFWVFYLGREHIFPWVLRPVPQKMAFLNVPFLFAREGASILALTVLSLVLVYYSVKADRDWLRQGRPPVATDYPWTGLFGRQWRFSPVLPAAYALILSLLAVDLIMSLDPRWYSTLFPGYYFIASFYAAIAALYLFVLLAGKRLGLTGYLLPRQYHDLGKLTFGFCIFTGYLFYAQFIVMWYGNLPDETTFMILRMKLDPWRPFSRVVLFMVFLIPFFVLLSKKIKIKRVPMIFVTLMILVGMWMENFLLVVPSLWPTRGGIPFGPLEVFVSAGFFGLVWLCVTLFLSRVPIVPVSDPLFQRFLREGKGTLAP